MFYREIYSRGKLDIRTVGSVGITGVGGRIGDGRGLISCPFISSSNLCPSFFAWNIITVAETAYAGTSYVSLFSKY
jgi:hypothetical protein